MTSSDKDLESTRSLLPLYVRGLLSAREKAEIEKALVGSPDLRNEVDRWRTVGAGYAAVEEELPDPPPWAYPRIARQMKRVGRLTFLERFVPVRKLTLAVVIAQLLIIVTLGVYILNSRTYRTSSAPSVTTVRTVRINVVFRGDAREEDVRRLLSEVHGRIVDGPYSSGLYVITVADDTLEESLTKLRANRIVAIAERVY